MGVSNLHLQRSWEALEKKIKLSNGQKGWLAPRTYCVCRISNKKYL